MGTLKDILDTVKGFEGQIADYIVGATKHKSIAKSSKDGICNFPVIVSNGMTIEDATLVCKAQEKQFASMLLTVITMNPHFNTMGGSASAANYINRLHQNIDVKADGTDVLNTLTSFIKEADDVCDVEYDQVSECIVAKVFESIQDRGIALENLKFNYNVTDVINHNVLNNMVGGKPVTEAGKPASGGMNYQTYSSTSQTIKDMDARQEIENMTHNGDIVYNIKGGNMPMGKGMGATRDSRPMQHMLDNDVKKANELVPTVLHVRIFPYDANKEIELAPIDFIIGVKATLHAVSTQEMVTNLVRGIRNDSKFFNFIRWTTGETKFMKDLVLGVNELKIDAMNNGKTASRWWTLLKRRKNMSKIKGIIMPNKLLPNATIMVTQEEVNTIKEQYGYDLQNPMIVNKLMEAYFLLSFVIVDTAMQRAHFIYDGSSEFETNTFAGLARENSVDDRKFKEMMNMLGRRV